MKKRKIIDQMALQHFYFYFFWVKYGSPCIVGKTPITVRRVEKLTLFSICLKKMFVWQLITS